MLIDVKNFALDSAGRAILNEEELLSLDTLRAAPSAGGSTNGACSGSTNSPRCSNSSCSGSTNPNCSNSGNCDNATNRYRCTNQDAQVDA